MRILLVFLALLLFGCRSTPDHLNVQDDLADVSWQLVDQDGNPFVFPDDVRGAVTMVGFIYTHCPDVCPMTTANMKQARDALDTEMPIRLISISFDPKRDTPEVLKGYAEAWEVDSPDWRFLTGDSTTVADLMNRLGIRYQIEVPPTSRAVLEQPDSTAQAPASYLVNHTDQITLLDDRGRVVGEYGGSTTPPRILVEDIEALQ